MSGLSEEVWRGDGDKVLCGERERERRGVESIDPVPRAQVGILLLLLRSPTLLLNIHLIPTLISTSFTPRPYEVALCSSKIWDWLF